MDLISTDEHGYYSCITFSDNGEDDVVYDAIPVILDVVDVPNVLEGPARLEDVVAVDFTEVKEESHPYGNYLLVNPKNITFICTLVVIFMLTFPLLNINHAIVPQNMFLVLRLTLIFS